MDIGDIHDFIDLITNKQQDEFFSPTDKDAAIDRSSHDFFWYFAPIYGRDAEAKAALDPFVQSFMVTPANSPVGIVTLPQGLPFPNATNFARLLSAMTISFDNTYGVQYNDIDIVNNDELAQRLKSQLLPVTRDRPAATTNGNGTFQLYPQQPNTAQFTYLSLPIKPVYGYTQVGRVITYNPGTSIQLQWNEAYLTKIINGAIVYLGLSLDDTALVQFMAQKSAS